ncbi:MAG: leucine-rich repeat protein, partial [Clostridia bacterium]|nr:leucine-rich repeat protein [Clostridia bacterium]
MFKKLFAVLLALALILSAVPLGLTVFADNIKWGYCGDDDYADFKNVRWEYNSDTRVLQFTGYGEIEPGESSGYSRFPKTAVTAIIGEGITGVPDYMFYNNKDLANVQLPSTVTSIGEWSFKGCSSLETIVLGDNVLTIGREAFADCENLTNVTLSNNITRLESSTFFSCSSLESIDLPDSLTYIGSSVFAYTGIEYIDIPDSVETYNRMQFYYCDHLKSFVIKDGTTVMPEMMFAGCSSLESVTIPKSVTTIDRQVFSNCTSLSKVYYGGTAEEWAEIQINGAGNQSLNEADIIFIGDSECEHNLVLTETLEATCDTPGYNEYYCTICGSTIRETLGAHHTYGEYTVIRKPTCVEPGEKVRYCTRCGNADYAMIAELDPDHISHVPGPYQVIKNPTVYSPGAEAIYCTRCETYYNQRAIPKLNPDLVISISLSSSKEVLLAGETSTISATVMPENTENKNVIWSSSDTSVAEVDNGIITAIAPGAAVIIAETEDGGFKDFCLVQVFSVNAQNGAQIDSDGGFIYGLAPKLDSVADYLGLDDETVSITYSTDVIGTGTNVYLKQGSTLISEYQVVIFGDVNGDGIYDAQDATVVNCIANGLLTREQVGEAAYTAADCNHDGSVDSSDVLILQKAGLLLSQVDQSKDDYMESDAYAEYLDLIDQTPPAEETPETPDEPIVPAQNPVS